MWEFEQIYEYKSNDYVSPENLRNINKDVKQKILVYQVDMNNFDKLKNKISKIKPDLIYHLATHAHVRESFDRPILTTSNNTVITVNLLEVIRKLKIDPLQTL